MSVTDDVRMAATDGFRNLGWNSWSLDMPNALSAKKLDLAWRDGEPDESESDSDDDADPLLELRTVIGEEFSTCLDIVALEKMIVVAQAVIAEEIPGCSGDRSRSSLALRDALWKRAAAGKTNLPAEVPREVKQGSFLDLLYEEADQQCALLGLENLDRSALSNSNSSTTPSSNTRSRKGRFLKKQRTKWFGPIEDEEPDGSPLPQETRREKEDRLAAEAARDKVIRSAFSKLAHDGQVHQDDAAKALELAGLVQPNEAWIRTAWSGLTKYTELKVHEFIDFVRTYEARQHEAFIEAFQWCDEDGSGSVEEKELKQLLSSFGIEPMTHVLEEVIREVDTNASGSLEFNEFTKVIDLLRAREGFTQSECQELLDVFRRFDRDGSGEMDAQELTGVLNWLGCAFEASKVQMIVAAVDVDQSGSIDAREFLVCMRNIRQGELEKLKAAVLANDADGSGSTDHGELEALLRSLGYLPDRFAVLEAAEDAQIAPGDLALDISDLWRLVQIFRRREGFSREEAAEIQRAFEKSDLASGSSGEIGVLDIGMVIRSIGYPLSFQMQQHLTSKVDIDGSGKLDLSELRKMIRMVRDRDLEACLEGFTAAAGQAEKAGKKQTQQQASLSVEDARRVLASVDFVLDSGQQIQFLDEDIVTQDDASSGAVVPLEAFLRASIRFYKEARRASKQSGGFTHVRLVELRSVFDTFDIDGSGDIGTSELVTLIEKQFPEMSSSPKLRSELVRLMQQVDENGDGAIDFQDFLRMMQHLQESQDRQKMMKENLATQEAKFAAGEVAEFRELFLAQGEGCAELTFDQVKQLISLILPMGDRNAAEFGKIFRRNCARQESVEGRHDLADFPEFLWLMRELLDLNFGNLREMTSGAPVLG